MSAGTDIGSAPLSGITVIDLTAVIAGPYATMWLADLGAEVIKIESPAGDTTRQAGHARTPGMGSVFLTLGRGKRSVCVDLKRPGGRQVVLDLCRTADVVVHNMRPDAIGRLGLAYDDVCQVQPEIVYAVLAGFDPAGPYRDRPAYDDMIQGMTGIASDLETVTGSPAYVPGVIADKNAGLILATTIVSALFHRERTGRGQQVTVPLFEAMAAYHLVEHLWDATFEPAIGPPGYVRVLSADRKPFPTADGHVCALPYQDKHFQAFFEAIGRHDLASDPRFASIPARLANIELVYRTLGEILSAERTTHWLTLFDAIGVPAVALGSIGDLLADPHLEAVGFFERVDHPTEGRLRVPRSPVLMSDSPPIAGSTAARLGQDTIDVLVGLGYEATAIDGLVATGAVVDGVTAGALPAAGSKATTRPADDGSAQ